LTDVKSQILTEEMSPTTELGINTFSPSMAMGSMYSLKKAVSPKVQIKKKSKVY
jgi:hypothetical protein